MWTTLKPFSGSRDLLVVLVSTALALRPTAPVVLPRVAHRLDESKHGEPLPTHPTTFLRTDDEADIAPPGVGLAGHASASMLVLGKASATCDFFLPDRSASSSRKRHCRETRVFNSPLPRHERGEAPHGLEPSVPWQPEESKRAHRENKDNDTH